MTSFRTYRAPLVDGEALVEPSFAESTGALIRNRKATASWNFEIGGLSFESLRKTARDDMVRDALVYTKRYRDVKQPSSGAAVVMAGHQPTLFHPGVWFKNFALDKMANGQRPGCETATAINLVIDNDVAASSAIRVPVVDSTSGLLRQESVLFDTAAGGVPYEQNRIRDRETFEYFGFRVESLVKPMVADSLIPDLWKHARAAVARCENVSCAIAQARHALEGEIGLQTLELPLSVVCRSESFSAFAMAVLVDIERFRGIYNQCLRTYRIEHHIRSKAHPVPELGNKDGWTEAPFWIYGDDSPKRKPTWVRRIGNRVEISDLSSRKVQIDIGSGETLGYRQLAELAGPHWKLRPRALMTTMYARMVLSDLFIHGIGGAKYDQLGDQIASLFFGVNVPEMMVVSATVRLPVDYERPALRSVQSLRNLIRSIRYAPETVGSNAKLDDGLLARKQMLIANIPLDAAKKSWHDEMDAINRSLAEQLVDERESLEAELLMTRQAAGSLSILKSREHSFCLFNLEHLQTAFRRMLG